MKLTIPSKHTFFSSGIFAGLSVFGFVEQLHRDFSSSLFRSIVLTGLCSLLTCLECAKRGYDDNFNLYLAGVAAVLLYREYPPGLCLILTFVCFRSSLIREFLLGKKE